MGDLGYNWITEGWIDFEYKKYQLLAYLSKVKERFDDALLYPQLSELVFHYNNLLSIKNEKKQLLAEYKKDLRGIDLKKMELIYERIIEDDELMKEIESIVEFSLPKMKISLNEGAELYQFVASKLSLDVVGILPLYKDEGYFLLGLNSGICHVYQYHHGIFHTADDTYKGLNIRYISEENLSQTNHYKQIKLKLIKSNKELPNPATYLIASEFQFPLNETLLPVAKRILLAELSK